MNAICRCSVRMLFVAQTRRFQEYPTTELMDCTSIRHALLLTCATETVNCYPSELKLATARVLYRSIALSCCLCY